MSNEYSLNYIKNKYLLKIIVDNISKNKLFKLIKNNKYLQDRLDIELIDYKKYYEQIEIELIPINTEEEKNLFINIEEKYRPYYHIFFNDNKNEINQNFFNKSDNITKIKILIDNEITSLENLFYKCKCLEKIKFIKFKRDNINNMSHMFHGCSSLKELDIINCNTSNVTNMSYMFKFCSSLKKLNLNFFNTKNVTDMNSMFYFCLSLRQLYINKFSTNKVINMRCMFSGCCSLEELNLNRFNTDNVIDMSDMFNECGNLKELSLNNFNTINVINVIGMFSGCTEELKSKIKHQYKNIKKEALEDLFANNY